MKRKRRIIITEDNYTQATIETLGKFEAVEMADILTSAVKRACLYVAIEKGVDLKLIKEIAAKEIMRD